MFRVFLRVIFSWDRWSVVKGTFAVLSPVLYTIVLWFTIDECLKLLCCTRAHLWPPWNNRNHSLNNTQGMKCGSCMWFCGSTILYLMPSFTVTFGILPDTSPVLPCLSVKVVRVLSDASHRICAKNVAVDGEEKRMKTLNVRDVAKPSPFCRNDFASNAPPMVSDLNLFQLAF